MDKTRKQLIEEIIFTLAHALSNPQYFAVKIKSDEISWKNILSIYIGLLTISTVITNSIFEYYPNKTALNNTKLALFQFIYIFIFSAVIRCIMILFKGIVSYEKTLKLFFIYGGVISIINSMLMMFDIYLHEGGSKFIVFFVSGAGATWIILSYLSILKINEVNGVARKLSAVLLLILSSLLLPNITSVIAPYLITINS
ncbi:hypothetical protein [Kluyvera sichuanensis]|uniref:hypothetical protein n=1 Tax=Kluyvera sichuanensis TaxID=2725494 RepID=UPI0039F58482